jgi:pyruvate,water dikinase
MVTVDATGGVIYAGKHDNLVEARQPEIDLFEDSSIHRVLDRVLDLVSPLRLLHPSDDDFIPENCVTFHDITRYTHQKSMEEMFQSAREMGGREKIGLKFRSDLPIDINIIYIDRDMAALGKRMIAEHDLESDPMAAFWNGIKEEGWPSRPWTVRRAHVKGTDRSDNDRHTYSESSFAVLSREYMILSLAMGYHFTSIEAMCTDSPGKNYISMQYKDGGASLDRRIRRIKLLARILSRLGFAQHRKGDFLHSILSYQDREEIEKKLFILGRLTLMTKQLDMALSSDAVTDWYTQDFMSKLGLEYAIEEHDEDALDE